MTRPSDTKRLSLMRRQSTRISTPKFKSPGPSISAPGTPSHAKRPRSSAAAAISSRPSSIGQSVQSSGLKLEDDTKESNIKVYVRCRGRNEREIQANSSLCLSTTGVQGKEVRVQTNQYNSKTYTFDKVFGAECDQNMVYTQVATDPLKQMLSGYNCTIFAYGQTGTGKTHTMTGDLDVTLKHQEPAENAGIIPRILFDIFRQLKDHQGNFSVKVSYVELYNEELHDLISSDYDRKIKIFDDSSNKRAVIVSGMEETFITTYEQGLDILRDGAERRQTAATKCNDASSRSHAVFTITLHLKEVTQGGEELVRNGKLNLVDLAGSENISRSGAEKKNAREGGMINQSLLTLGRVINSLVEHSPHIPYRESKLTRLLKDSLGGKTKTCIIATVTPARDAIDETLSTLEYASRAKNIKNKPQANETLSKQAHFTEFVAEIERLKADLVATRQQNGIFLSAESHQNLVNENESQKVLVQEQKMRLDVVELELRQLRGERENFDKEAKALSKQLEMGQSEIHHLKQVLSKSESEMATIKGERNYLEGKLVSETATRKSLELRLESLNAFTEGVLDNLNETADNATKMQDKVARQMVAHNANASTIDLFQKNMRQWLNALNSTVEDLQHTTETNSGALQSNIEICLKEHDKGINATLNSFENIRSELVQLEGKLKSHSSAQGAEHSRLLHSIIESVKVLESDTTCEHDFLLTSTRELICASTQAFGTIVEIVSRNCVTVSAGLQELFSSIGKKLVEQSDIISKLSESVELRQRSISASTNLVDEQCLLACNDHIRQNEVARNQLLESITALINAYGTEERERQLSIAKQVSIGSSKIADECGASHRNEMNMISELNKAGGVIGQHLQSSEFNTSLVKLQRDVDEEVKAARKDSCSAISELDTLQERNATLLTNFSSSIADGLDNLRAQAQTVQLSYSDRVQDLSSTVAAILSGAEMNVTQSQESTQQMVEHVNPKSTFAHVHKFANCQLETFNSIAGHVKGVTIATIEPTGTTPSEREYNVPRCIPKFDKIIAAKLIESPRHREPFADLEPNDLSLSHLAA